MTRVRAAPNTAEVATPQDRMPGVRYWIGWVSAASTWWASVV
jgi:hypothetical protein